VRAWVWPNQRYYRRILEFSAFSGRFCLETEAGIPLEAAMLTNWRPANIYAGWFDELTVVFTVKCSLGNVNIILETTSGFRL
jgi:hypothetical protein